MNLFNLGNKGALSIHIEVHTDPQALAHGYIVPLEHPPSWKIGKNTFSASALNKHNGGGGGGGGAPQRGYPPGGGGGGGGQQVIHHPYGSAPPMPQVVYAYDGGQDVGGVVHLTLPHGKSYEHLGIKIQFLGRISMAEAQIFEGRPKYDFISLVKELAPPGILYQTQTTIPFRFTNVEKQYETYHGRNLNVTYYVRVLVERKFLPPLKNDHEVIVQVRDRPPPVQKDIKMEVGIEECLHIEFEFEKKIYHLRDCIVGKVNFVTVRIKIKYMELAVIRRETCGEMAPTQAEGMPSMPGGQKQKEVITETQTLIRHEIMDGAPVKGEVIPVRLFLGGIPADLTPTYNAGRFSIRYYLNLVLVDEVDRRYFKQQEIILWRKELG